MDLIFNKIFLNHDTGMHPESRKRLESIPGVKEREVPSGENDLSLIHTPRYIRAIRELCEKGGGHLDADTIVSPQSYDAAVHAVGATIMASQQNDFALVRPPGHHAYPDHASGFCVFNNMAIAAQKLVQEGKRVLIFDFDGHLGDGIEEIFYGRANVLYWSIHQYPAFPQRGDEDEIGEGEGTGFTINVPLPPGSGDDILARALKEFLPIVKQFAPDVVGVSAGFDAHQYDLLLNLRLSAGAYYDIGRMLRENFSNVFATLEGGYNIEFLPRCLMNFVNGVNGKKIFFEEDRTESTIQVIDEYEVRSEHLKRNLSKYWKV